MPISDESYDYRILVRMLKGLLPPIKVTTATGP